MPETPDDMLARLKSLKESCIRVQKVGHGSAGGTWAIGMISAIDEAVRRWELVDEAKDIIQELYDFAGEPLIKDKDRWDKAVKRAAKLMGWKNL